MRFFTRLSPRRVAQGALFSLVVLMASLYLPGFYVQLVGEEVEKSHLFYSPVAREFLYQEKIVGSIPPQAREKAEGHHLQLAYRMADGSWLSRHEFERLLPFIYYKNMELQGLLPLQLDGRSFGKKEIQKSRRVLEVKAREMNRPQSRVYPLFEPPTNQVRLVFPEDRFAGDGDGLHFINADTGHEEQALSAQFTKALQTAGFRFPPRRIFGRFTVLKPYDAGAFLLDDGGHLFQLQRRQNSPVVKQVSLPPGLQVRYVKVSESRRRDWVALVVGEKGGVLLFPAEGGAPVPLHLPGYHPKTMDLKLLFNPVTVTAVYSDERESHALAMDTNFTPLPAGIYHHTMSRATTTPAVVAGRILFPFVLSWQRPESGFVAVYFSTSWYGLLGLAQCLFCYACWKKLQGKRVERVPLVLVGVFGVYGVLGLLCVGE